MGYGEVIFNIHYRSVNLIKFMLEKSIDEFLELVNFIKYLNFEKYLDFDEICIPLEDQNYSKIKFAENTLRRIKRNRTW